MKRALFTPGGGECVSFTLKAKTVDSFGVQVCPLAAESGAEFLTVNCEPLEEEGDKDSRDDRHPPSWGRLKGFFSEMEDIRCHCLRSL